MGRASENPPADQTIERIGQSEKQNPRDFDEAFYAALLSRAQSDPARHLVESLATLVERHELAASDRVNRSIAKFDKLKIAVERFLADLLSAQATERSKGYVYRSMRPKGFTSGEVGFRTFRRLVKSLADLGMVEVFKGFQTLSELGPYIRKATRFRTTKRLLELCEQHGVRPADFHQHFAVPLPEHPLQLRGKVKRTQFGDRVRGRLIRFEPTPRTDRLEKQVKDLNRFFDSVELRGGVHRGYLRIFNNGDDPNFDWDMGGRLYSHLEGNYQQMDREARLRMTMNGEPVCEIDIRASYLTIFHALHGKRLDPDKDPYDIPGLGPEARDIVKMWVTASFGNNAPLAKWPRDLRAKYGERTGKTLGKRHTALIVGEKVMQSFPLLARLADKHQQGWAKLMYIESQAMIATMTELMREQIPSLAVHDSIIVPRSKGSKANEVLKKHYRKFAKVTPVLKTTYPEGRDPYDF